MKLQKYHGLGNSFLFIEYQKDIIFKELAKRLCNDKTSIGGDGLIVVKNNPLEMLIYNKDGTEALMCGNGIRCFIHYCVNNALLINRTKNIEVRTKSGIYNNEIISFEPFLVQTTFNRSLIRKEKIDIFGELYDSYYVLVGVKHNVIVVDKDNKQTIGTLTYKLLKHQGFLEETNIDLVEIIDKNTIKVTTYERGVGFTSSCGTGSIAGALVSNYLFDGSNQIKVISEYGCLSISIQENKVYMIGPSIKVCDVEVSYD